MSDYTIEELLDINTTANWGANPEKEIRGEVFVYILTGLQTVPYYYEMGTELKRSILGPLLFTRAIQLAVQIAESVQQYNDDSYGSSVERRVHVPFEDIEFEDAGRQEGELNALVRYIEIRKLPQVGEAVLSI